MKKGLELLVRILIITTFEIRNSVLRSSCVIPLARKGLASVHRIVEDTVFLLSCLTFFLETFVNEISEIVKDSKDPKLETK